MYEDAACNNPCGAEPMGCAACMMTEPYVPDFDFEDYDPYEFDYEQDGSEWDE